MSKERYDQENRKTQEIQKPEKIQLDYLLLETSVAVERAQAKFMVAYTEK